MRSACMPAQHLSLRTVSTWGSETGYVCQGVGAVLALAGTEVRAHAVPLRGAVVPVGVLLCIQHNQCMGVVTGRVCHPVLPPCAFDGRKILREGRGSNRALAGLVCVCVCVLLLLLSALDSNYNPVASTAGAGTVACPLEGSCPLPRPLKGVSTLLLLAPAWSTGRRQCTHTAKGGGVGHSLSLCVCG